MVHQFLETGEPPMEMDPPGNHPGYRNRGNIPGDGRPHDCRRDLCELHRIRRNLRRRRSTDAGRSASLHLPHGEENREENGETENHQTGNHPAGNRPGGTVTCWGRKVSTKNRNQWKLRRHSQKDREQGEAKTLTPAGRRNHRRDNEHRGNPLRPRAQNLSPCRHPDPSRANITTQNVW